MKMNMFTARPGNAILLNGVFQPANLEIGVPRVWRALRVNKVIVRFGGKNASI